MKLSFVEYLIIYKFICYKHEKKNFAWLLLNMNKIFSFKLLLNPNKQYNKFHLKKNKFKNYFNIIFYITNQ